MLKIFLTKGYKQFAKKLTIAETGQATSKEIGDNTDRGQE